MNTPSSLFGIGPIDALMRHCEEIARTSPDDVQQLASIMQIMIISYYKSVRLQALLAFFAAFILEIVAVVFFFYSASLTMNGRIENGVLAATSGFLIQIMTAIVFYLYSQSARQFGGFHICLERTNRFLLANAMTEHLPEADRAAKRAEVITTILNAPMLTLSMIEKAS